LLSLLFFLERDRISAGESDPELEEWEKQQIRKGVSQAQVRIKLLKKDGLD